MCQECGCGDKHPFEIISEKKGGGYGHHHGHHSSHGENHHGDGHAHPQEEKRSGDRRHLDLGEAVLSHNDRLAERNRGYFKAKGICAINLLSSPGAGKTALLEKTLDGLQGQLLAGVVVGDPQTDLDAQRLRGRGAPVLQVVTGQACHLDAHMVAHAVEEMEEEATGLKILFLENVGNLVCPAAFDLGEKARVVLFSVTEGEDKPLKYPVIFKSADLILVTKMDLAEASGFDEPKAMKHLKSVAPQARVLALSSKTGAGFSAWMEWLASQQP